jgi:carbon-monoxide dehydrogenase large subunit
MEVRSDGSALVLTGSSSHGQGHHTAFAQLAADVTGIPFDKIEVRHGDTDEVARGGGTGGSRSLQVGGSAVHEAGELVVDQARNTAADLLEANPADIVLDTTSGVFAVTGSPSISKTWAEVASHLEARGDLLKAETDFQPPGATFPFGAHLSVVEIDRETGEVTVLRHISCDDAGTIVNPLIFDGQVHGGVASGIAHTLMEEFIYDDEGNPLTGNFMDYAFTSAAEVPSFERIAMETPTDRNPLGAKGIGEAGTIGAGPAVHNAVVDALSHLGVRHVEMPTTPQRVWSAMNP